MKVKNINGRRQNSCKCGPWLDHWSKISCRPVPQHCSESRCMHKPELGAHVQKDSPTDTNWYIIPLCIKHSIRAESLEIADTTVLVSAHVGETCAQPLPIGNVWHHDLRNSLATNGLTLGAETTKVQDWLDHATSAKSRLEAKRKPRPEDIPQLTPMF
jgi:hypothetical protein